MRQSVQLLAQGFWRRSLEEVRKQAKNAVTFEALNEPTGPFPLVTFADSESISQCKKMSDKDMGGFSTADLDLVPASGNEPAHARFHGNISTELPKNKPEIQRSGFAGWRTLDRGPTIFGKSLWDVDRYLHLALRVKSDGRSYYINVQTESIVPTDLHQHRLYARNPGAWETILLNWDDFVRTNHGIPVEPQREMLKQKVRTVGISLTDGVPGPYDLCISRIWASNGLSEEDKKEAHWTSNLERSAKKLASETSKSSKPSSTSQDS